MSAWGYCFSNCSNNVINSISKYKFRKNCIIIIIIKLIYLLVFNLFLICADLIIKLFEMVKMWNYAQIAYRNIIMSVNNMANKDVWGDKKVKSSLKTRAKFLVYFFIHVRFINFWLLKHFQPFFFSTLTDSVDKSLFFILILLIFV